MFNPSNLVEVYEVKSSALDHGLLRVDHCVEQRVEALVLVQAGGADGLKGWKGVRWMKRERV